MELIMNMALAVRSVEALLCGAVVSVQIASLSCFIGITLGTVLGLLQFSKQSAVTFLVSTYVTIIRGTPQIVQIYLLYFALPQLSFLPWKVSAFWAAVIALGLNSSAYVSNIIKSGISSVDKGQIEAARVLGLSGVQRMRYIILPQAVRVVFPALSNELITLIKDSSLASIIGVMELSKQGSIIRSVTYDALTVFTVVGFIYLVMTTVTSLILGYIERRMNHVGH
jgi:glutamine transport system permease protein